MTVKTQSVTMLEVLDFGVYDQPTGFLSLDADVTINGVEYQCSLPDKLIVRALEAIGVIDLAGGFYRDCSGRLKVNTVQEVEWRYNEIVTEQREWYVADLVREFGPEYIEKIILNVWSIPQEREEHIYQK